MSNSTFEAVHVSVTDAIAEVRLARPGKMNAIDGAMVDGLIAAGERLIGSQGLRAVVMSGEGAAFCAGLDKAIFDEMRRGENTGGALAGKLAHRSYGDANRFQKMVLVWREVPVPVIAALHGVAFGGGLQIALGADLRVAAPDTKLSVMEIEWGLVPDCGGTLLMRDLANDGLLRDLTFTGRIFSGTEALGYGFVTRLADDPSSAARAIARDIANKNPDAIRAAKRLLNAVHERTTAEILLAESVEQDAIMLAANQAEAVAARLERRKPAFIDP